MRLDSIARRLAILEPQEPPQTDFEERVKRILQLCDEPELRQLLDIFARRELTDEDDKIFWGIMKRYGWFDHEPD